MFKFQKKKIPLTLSEMELTDDICCFSPDSSIAFSITSMDRSRNIFVITPFYKISHLHNATWRGLSDTIPTEL